MTRDRRDEGVGSGGEPRLGEALVRSEGADGEEELRQDFRALRAELARSGRVPGFEAMLRRARAEATSGAGARVSGEGPVGEEPRPSVRRRLWTALAAAAAAAGLLLVGLPRSDADAEFERLVSDYSANPSGGAWRSPTASLLDIPGVDLGSVPSFGASLRGTDLSETDASEGRDS